MPDLETEVFLAAVYERRVGASLERVWENVHDWEHLPWLHATSFAGIELLEAAEWGWRARIQVWPREKSGERVVELRRDPERELYHARTLEGPGSGGDTLTRLSPRSASETDVRVEFWLPLPDPKIARAIGEQMVALYTRLWDEDESMMRARQAFLDRREDEKEPTPPPQRLALGHWDDLRSRLPLLISAGERDYRLVAQGAEVVAHSTVCPHMGGPLEASEIIDGSIVCPWHGYRFSLGDGRAAEGRPCRLEEAPRVERDRNGMAQLVFDSGSI